MNKIGMKRLLVSLGLSMVAFAPRAQAITTDISGTAAIMEVLDVSESEKMTSGGANWTLAPYRPDANDYRGYHRFRYGGWIGAWLRGKSQLTFVANLSYGRLVVIRDRCVILYDKTIKSLFPTRVAASVPVKTGLHLYQIVYIPSNWWYWRWKSYFDYDFVFGTYGVTSAMLSEAKTAEPTFDISDISVTSGNGSSGGVTIPNGAPGSKKMDFHAKVTDRSGDYAGYLKLSLSKASKKGIAKLSGSFQSIEGYKLALRAVQVEVGSEEVEVSTYVSGFGDLNVQLSAEGVYGTLDGYDVESTTVGGSLSQTPASALSGLFDDYELVDNGRLKWKVSKAGALSGTFSYTSLFSGKKVSAKVTGMVLDGVGYAIVTLKGVGSKSVVIGGSVANAIEVSDI